MAKYFACNLPHRAPYWLHPTVIPSFNDTIDRIYRRMDTLEAAMDITGLDGATFSKYAKMLFDDSKDAPGKFDTFTSEDIAQYVCLMNDGSTAEARLEWPNATVIVDTAFVTTEEWESIRHLGIGGSDAAVVMGTSHFQTGWGLYHDKCGTPMEKEKNSQVVFDRGHIMEDRVIGAFCNLTGAKVIPETRMFASKKYPNCTANIDAIIRFSDGRIFIFEAKTTIRKNWKSWASDKIPAHYIPQMRQYPAVLDDDRICGTYIGCMFIDDTVVKGYYVNSEYDEKQFVARFVERDKVEEDAQLASEERWFADYVLQNEEPEFGEPGQTLKTLRQMSGPANQNLHVAEWNLSDYQDIVDQYLKYSEQISTLDKRTKKLREARTELTLGMVKKLGAGIQANIPIDGNTYFEIKNAPRLEVKVDVETLTSLFDVAAPLLPAELVEEMRGCVVKNPDAFRVFSIKKKVHR